MDDSSDDVNLFLSGYFANKSFAVLTKIRNKKVMLKK